ncbi:hypothetical protein H1R20_g11533, partial [Candolleomyces eurysporus]
MSPKSKKRGVLSRVFSRFSNRKSQPAVVHAHDQLDGSSKAASEPSSSDFPSTHSVPDLHSKFPDNSLRSYGSQPPISRGRSDNEAAHSSYRAALSGNQDFPRPPQSFPTPHHSYDHPARPGVHGGTASFLASASGFRMRDINYYEASHVPANTGGSAGENSIDGWELLLKNIAPNALHDSSARYDAPKCDEDTRVEVIGEIMDWVQDRNAPQRLLCLTGAAGAGKSALQQTIAECCAKSNVLGGTFFLSSADPTRNRASTIVGTIAYQFGLKHPLLQSAIVAAVKRDPLIFSRSKDIDIDTFPYAILIDGLDECKGEPNDIADPTHLDVDYRRRGEDRQAELLDAVKHCILNHDLPFRVFIASRPEWAIRTALEPGGALREVAYRIELSNKYDASGDMRRYLHRRFEDIGLRTGDPKWFSEGDIETLVQAASGQFIYVATIYKYISERRASPAERLKIVLAWTPHGGQTARPFEALDRLYTKILSAARNAYEAVDTHHGRDFLLLFRAHHLSAQSILDHVMPSSDLLSALLGLESRAEEVLISDLRSLVDFEMGKRGDLRLQDWVYTHLAKCCMRHIIECPLDFNSPIPDRWDALPLPESHRLSLRRAIVGLPYFLITPLLSEFFSSSNSPDNEVVDFTRDGGWGKIDHLSPLLYHSLAKVSYHTFGSWIEGLRRFSFNLNFRKPEAAAVIFEFVKKVDA